MEAFTISDSMLTFVFTLLRTMCKMTNGCFQQLMENVICILSGETLSTEGAKCKIVQVNVNNVNMDITSSCFCNFEQRITFIIYII